MPKKYTIPVTSAPPRFTPVGRYASLEFREDCAGSCRECVKKTCVYDIFRQNYRHISTMPEPEYLYSCMGCFRCVQECTRGIFSLVMNPEYRELGNDYWRPGIISDTWYQAHTGKIPVSGAGYRGPFSGEGFDGMWTDMSEIVRPTRDGIHGREYINTSIELTRRLSHLRFGGDTQPAAPLLEIPIPVLFQQPARTGAGSPVLTAAAEAAHRLGTMMFIRPGDCTQEILSRASSIVPCLVQENLQQYDALVGGSRMIELAHASGMDDTLAALRSRHPGLAVSVGMPLDFRSVDRAVHLARSEADTLHFYADDRGREQGTQNPRFLSDMIRDIHGRLVECGLRQKINLIFSGGIALAEHMAKAVICGSDGVVIDTPLLIALECRLCGRCRKGRPCPVRIDACDPAWAAQRIVNLMGAWRNQLIEIMGAMGIREARRLRGETGRAMWFDDLEKENFGPIFGEKKRKAAPSNDRP